MYLFERIFALSIYVITLFIIFFIIYNSKYKSLKRVLLIYTIVLSIMGFFFVPAKGNDLYRINIALNAYSKMNFAKFFNSVELSQTPIATIYYYVIAKIGNFHLLPAITCFITFSNIFYIVRDYSKKQNIDNKSIALTIFYIMATGFFFDVISGIRNFLAFSILARCFYDELYNSKKMYKNFIFYIIACLTHISSFGVIGLRFIYYFFNKKDKIVNKIIVIVFLLGISAALKGYFINAIDIFNEYVNDSSYFWIWDFIKLWIVIIVSLFVIKNTKKEPINSFYYIILIFTLIYIKEYSTFARFSYFNVLLSIPIFMKFYSESKKIKNKQLVIVITFIILAISCARGNLTSLKFFEL